MSLGDLQLGAVYQPDWDDRPIRVLAFDQRVVMYDSWRHDLSAWDRAHYLAQRRTRRATYYRLSIQHLSAHAQYLRLDEYTDDEFRLHRPDLPFAFAQFETVQWYDDRPESESEARGMQSIENELLDTPEVYVSPFGPKESIKPGKRIRAKDGRAFPPAELLWFAWCLQAPLLRERQLTAGVGLHRLGVQGGFPWYYVWGSKSLFDAVIDAA